MQPIISPLGDSALTVTFGTIINKEINCQVYSLFTHLKEQNYFGVKDLIPAYASVTIVYDLLLIKQLSNGSAYQYMYNKTAKIIKDLQTIEPQARGEQVIPICYDSSLGWDLDEMAMKKNLPIEEIIQLHVSTAYRVYMIGFLPGFAYMGSVDERIATSRKPIPRTTIPAGSVGIAGEQTGIYPLDSPGGWNIIGRTPIKLFDASSNEPCLLQPGDIVRFQLISLEEYNQIKGEQ